MATNARKPNTPALAPAVINMSAKKPASKKSKIDTVEGVVSPETVDACYAEKVTLDNAEAAFKASSAIIKAVAADYMQNQPGTINLPGNEVAAQICVKRSSMSVSDPVKAKAAAGARFSRYIDEKVVGVMYVVSARDRAKVADILKAAGEEPDALMRETIQAEYAVREQYAADLSDGTLDAVLGDNAEEFKSAIDVRAGSVSIKFVGSGD